MKKKFILSLIATMLLYAQAAQIEKKSVPFCIHRSASLSILPPVPEQNEEDDEVEVSRTHKPTRLRKTSSFSDCCFCKYVKTDRSSTGQSPTARILEEYRA